MKKSNIILVDDHVVIRNGLKALIEKLGAFKVVQEFDNGRQLIDSLRAKASADLVIMDLSMPEMDGEEAATIIKTENIDVPVLILTLNEDDQTIVRLFRLGIRGYLQKNCSANTMREAIESILNTGYYHNEFLAFSLRSNEQQPHKTHTEKILDQLTDRERQFLKLVCHEKEYTYDQIADIMSIQHRTVDGYRESIFDKFGIKSKTGLVLFILRNQLFDSL